MKIHSRLLRRFALAAGLIGLAGCATNPVTGRPQLALITEGQEIEMGRQAAEQVEQTIGLVQDPALQQYVDAIGQRLAAESERPELPWRFGVVDDPTPNAFALPGGFIYVTRGLLSLMDSEAELAAVLGHEIGHVTARHSVTQISRAQLGQIGLVLGQIFVPELRPFGDVLGGGMQLMMLKYGRDAERQADDLGFRYALQEGYNLTEMDDIFASLQRVGEKEGQSPLPSWLATHPAPEERIESIQERLARLGGVADTGRIGKPELLRHIEGMVYGNNPRNGFFEGSLFLHPDLRFRLNFPNGWRTQNLPQAVVAVEPQQQAIVQFTFAPGAGAEQSAQQFFAQQGVQAGSVSRETINGQPAVVGYFQAQTQQGVIRGVASFVEHGGRTYQILGYSPAQGFSRYDNEFRRTIGSFATLTDPRALNVQPDRLRVVEIDRTMTLAEFHRRYPTDVPLDELALINQVVGAETRLPAGMLVKTVTEG